MNVALLQQPNELRVTRKELRRLAPGEVLVRVHSCGICGTDVHIVEGSSRSSPPVVLGHEYAGIIEDAGDAGGTFSPGQRVAIDPNISCGTCYYCRRGLVHLCEHLRALGVDIDGGMAELCIVPATQLYVLPGELSLEVAPFIEPVSCAVHGIDLAGIRTGDVVVILGGGTIGLIMLQMARHAGASRTVIVEPLQPKRDTAKLLGATDVIDPGNDKVTSAVRSITGQGADVIIECVGSPETAELALTLARRGGRIVLFGVCPVGKKISVEPNAVYFRELTIIGSYVNPHTFVRAVEVMRSGIVRVDLFRIDRFPLAGVHEALKLQKEGRTTKCIIQPNA